MTGWHQLAQGSWVQPAASEGARKQASLEMGEEASGIETNTSRKEGGPNLRHSNGEDA